MTLFELAATLSLDTSQFDQQVKRATDGSQRFAQVMTQKVNTSNSALIKATRAGAMSIQEIADNSVEAAEIQSEALEDIRREHTMTQNSWGDTLRKLGRTVFNFGKAFVTGSVAIGTTMVALVEKTKDYRAEMGKLSTAFAVNNLPADTATSTYKELQAVLGDTDKAVETSAHIAAMAKQFDDLSAWVTICTGVFATFGDSLPTESLTEAANETAKVGKVTGALADALNWAGKDEEEFNKQLESATDERERFELITDTLVSLYSEAAEKYKTANADLIEGNKATERLRSAMADLGAVLQPVITKMTTWGATMAEKVTPKVGELVEDLTPMVEDGFKWIADNGESVKTAFTAIAGGATVLFAVAHPLVTTLTAAASLLAYFQKVGEESSGMSFQEWVGDSYTPEEVRNLQDYITALKEYNAALDELDKYGVINKDLIALEKAKNDAYKVVRPSDSPFYVDILDAYETWLKEKHAEGKEGILDVLVDISDDSEENLQSSLDALNLEGIVTLRPSYQGFDSVFDYAQSLLNSSEADGSHASGLDYVPRDGYRAILHQGEAVLTRQEASAWRNGSSASTDALLSRILSLLEDFDGLNVIMNTTRVGDAVTRRVSRNMDRDAMLQIRGMGG